MARARARIAVVGLALAAGAAMWAEPCLAGARENALLSAVRERDHIAIRKLLADGAQVNAPLADGSVPLGWAIQRVDRGAVRMLLDAGADALARDSYGDPLLAAACETGDDDILAALLAKRADARATRADGISAFALCAATAAPATLKTLAALGADVNAADPLGQTPLMHAAASGADENIKALLALGAKVNVATRKGATPLFFAVQSGDAQAPGLLLDGGADATVRTPEGMTLLEGAAIQRNIPVATTLINRGADLEIRDSRGRQIIHILAANGLAELIPVALARGSKVEAMTVLPVNAPDGDAAPAVVSAPVRDRAVPATTAKGAVKFPLKEVSRRELAAPLPPAPRSPLMLAAAAGSVETMKALVAGGANSKARAPDGLNVLLAAVPSGSLEAIRYALDLDPNIATTTNSGRSVLHLAVRIDDSDQAKAVIGFLVEKGASLDARDKLGVSAVEMVERIGPPPLKPFMADLHRAATVSASMPQRGS